jgi:hypothetical protein
MHGDDLCPRRFIDLTRRPSGTAAYTRQINDDSNLVCGAHYIFLPQLGFIRGLGVIIQSSTTAFHTNHHALERSAIASTSNWN